MTLKDPEYYTAPWVSAKPQIFKLQLPVDRSIIGEEFCVPPKKKLSMRTSGISPVRVKNRYPPNSVSPCSGGL